MDKKLFWEKESDLGALKEYLECDGVAITSTDTVFGFLANITKTGFNEICRLKNITENRPFLILISKDRMLEKLFKFADIGSLDQKTLDFVQNCWPAPITFIFRANCDLKNSALSFLTGFVKAGKKNHEELQKGLDYLNDLDKKGIEEIQTVAIRCPEHAGLQNVLKHFDGLFSTSANKTGMPAPVKFEDIDKNLLEQVKYAVICEQVFGKQFTGEQVICEKVTSEQVVCNSNNLPGNGNVKSAQASTIVDLTCPDYTKEFPYKIVREGEYGQGRLLGIYKGL